MPVHDAQTHGRVMLNSNSTSERQSHPLFTFQSDFIHGCYQWCSGDFINGGTLEKKTKKKVNFILITSPKLRMLEPYIGAIRRLSSLTHTHTHTQHKHRQNYSVCVFVSVCCCNRKINIYETVCVCGVAASPKTKTKMICNCIHLFGMGYGD